MQGNCYMQKLAHELRDLIDTILDRIKYQTDHKLIGESQAMKRCLDICSQIAKGDKICKQCHDKF